MPTHSSTRRHATRRGGVAVSLVASVALLASACGDDDDAASVDDTAATATATDVTGPPASAATPGSADASTPPDTSIVADEGGAGGSTTSADASASTAGSAADCDVPYEDGDPDAAVTFVSNVPPRQFDPHRTPSIVGEYPQLSVVYDRLLEIRAGPVICPLVAESWEFNGDGTELTLHLDPDAVFWDGTPIDAAAVKANLDRAREAESTVKSFLGMVTSVDVVDDGTVTIVANRPAGDLPAVLGTLVGAMVNPAAFADPDALASAPAGSGPYDLTDLVVNDRATYTRRDDYWNESTAGNAKTLVYASVPGDLNKLNVVRTGDADIAFFQLASWQDFEQFVDSPEGEAYTITKYPSGATFQILFNIDRPPLDNELVRQALNYAIDRESITDTVLYGQCPPTSQMLQAIYPGHLPELADHYTYDPDKAKELLTEAGYADGFPLEIAVGSGLSPQVDFAQIVQAQLGDIGIDVTVTEGDLLDINPRFGQGGIDAYSSTRTGAADAGVVLLDNYRQGPRFPGTTPPDVLAAINATVDPTVTGEERTQLLEDANRMITEQALDLFICATSSTYLHADEVINADLMGVSYYSGVYDMRYVTKRAS